VLHQLVKFKLSSIPIYFSEINISYSYSFSVNCKTMLYFLPGTEMEKWQMMATATKLIFWLFSCYVNLDERLRTVMFV